mmetsp:Transcript_23666/g.35029  ORF Transcript_23666/g.35029 Transcript_23666/m.35029 type:complete len:613 (-) Transcript_23666:111-1949(-)
MIEDVVLKQDEFVIDPTRIYMTGHSNGCVGSLAMAASQSDVVAAVCCHAGTLATEFGADTGEYDPVPIWMVHGELDSVLPYNGRAFEDGLGFIPLAQSFQYMADQNGCDADVVEAAVASGTSLKRNSSCTNGATVELITLPQSGHSPYLNADFGWENGTLTTVDTTAWAWDFCSAQSKAAIPEVFQRQSNTTTTSPTTVTAGNSTAAPAPTVTPSQPKAPSPAPSTSLSPTASAQPSKMGTVAPVTVGPTQAATAQAPTSQPSAAGASAPTVAPTMIVGPTTAPVTATPTQSIQSPTVQPTVTVGSVPSVAPTMPVPTIVPVTTAPSQSLQSPTTQPTVLSVSVPTVAPTMAVPTSAPSPAAASPSTGPTVLAPSATPTVVVPTMEPVTPTTSTATPTMVSQTDLPTVATTLSPTKAQTNLPPAIPLVNPVRDCTSGDPCGRCEGDCDSDSQCEGTLVCFQKDKGEENVDAVGGCLGDDQSRTDWCTLPVFVGRDDEVPAPTPQTTPMPPSSSSSGNEIPLVKPVRECSKENKCKRCEGDCDKDEQCEGSLICFQRDKGLRGQQAVPGCIGHDLSRTDWCAESLSRDNRGGVFDGLFRDKSPADERDVKAKG